MKFHKDGTSPQNGEVFVFGSNLAGRHGGGAARAAYEKFGAVYGVGIGLTGNSYAIPTKDHYIETMPLNEIEPHVKDFIDFTKKNPNVNFFVTGIGCGLAGYSAVDIAPMFVGCGDNCSFPDNWEPHMIQQKETYEDLLNEVKEWRKLKDPANLHANLLRGFPAKLTQEQLNHLAGK